MNKMIHGSQSFCSDQSKNAILILPNKENPSDVSFGEEIIESPSFSRSQDIDDLDDLNMDRKALGSSFIDREKGVKECQREQIIIQKAIDFLGNPDFFEQIKLNNKKSSFKSNESFPSV